MMRSKHFLPICKRRQRFFIGQSKSENSICSESRGNYTPKFIDKRALLSSANLTDDAFLRNLELGVLFTGGDMPSKLREHLST
jgi:hypothetical protein